jgi:hypothetical protein
MQSYKPSNFIQVRFHPQNRVRLTFLGVQDDLEISISTQRLPVQLEVCEGTQKRGRLKPSSPRALDLNIPGLHNAIHQST